MGFKVGQLIASHQKVTLLPGAALLAALLVVPLTSWSQTPAGTEDFTSMSLEDLMDLKVFTSASLVPTQASKAPSTAYSFTNKYFARMGVRRLEDLLQFVPGMQLNQYRKRHKTIWTRGLLSRYNDKLVLMVDGVLVKHLYYGHFALGDNFPLEQVEKVEIIQGPASSLYGANAFGGIISITTRDFADQPEGAVTVEMGNYQRRKATALANSANIQLFGSTLSQEAPFRSDRKSFIGGSVVQPPDEDYDTLFIKARPIDGLTLQLHYADSETPFLFIPNTQDAYIDNRNLTLAANYEAGNLQDGKLEATVFHTRDKTLEYEVENKTDQLGYLEQQNGQISSVLMKGLKEVGSHTLAVGASGQLEQMGDTDFVRYYSFREGFLNPPQSGNLLISPEADYTDYAGFVQDVWHLLPELEITAGARRDQFDNFGGHTNYRAAAVYTPTEQQTWKLMYGTAIRTPSVREALKNLDTELMPPTPEPEEIKSLELDYIYQWHQASAQLNLFRNQVDNYILEQPTADGRDEYFANLEDTWTMTGAETVVHYKPVDAVGASFTLSYQEVRGSRTNDVPYLANWNGSFLLDYQLNPDHHLGLSFTFSSDRPDTNNFVNDDPKAFVLANLFASGALSKQLSYGVGIDNLLNKRVYNPAGDFGSQYNTENHGREFWLRLEWSFSH